MIQLTLTQKMTTAQVVETSVTVNNSPIQDFVHSDDHAQPTYPPKGRWIVYNHPQKGRWIVVDIYRDAKRQGIYLALWTDPEEDSCFSIYQISWIKKQEGRFCKQKTSLS